MIKLTHILLAFTLSASTAWCTNPESPESQSEIREGTVEIDMPESVVSVSDYPFLNESFNYINMNGDDWGVLRDKFRHSDTSAVSIVHIGDSHIQADVSTDRIRNHFWNHYGSGGRGLITPLKICGTNEPFNYKFTTNGKPATAKLMKLPWMTDMGFTGTSFTPRSMKFNVGLSTAVTNNPEGELFKKIRLFSNGKIFVDRINDGKNRNVEFEIQHDDNYVDIMLDRPVSTVDIDMHSFEPVTIYGAELTGDNRGVIYSAIGNNGATYGSYNRLGSMGDDVSMLSPDLVIISLGTNEAFGKVSDESFYAEIDYLINDIERHNPGVKILLTTPKECQRVIRTGRGRRRKVKSYTVNTNVKRMRDVIIDYGQRNGIPVYDWYEVAGGDGASNKWIESKLLNTDRIHNTHAGYEVAGDMLYDALQQAIFNKHHQSNN